MRSLAVTSTIMLLLLEARTAAAEGTANVGSCVNDHEQAQALMQDGKLLMARDAFLACATEACPELVREDCARLHEEVAAAIPTIIPVAMRGGMEIRNVRVLIDGVVVPEQTQKMAIPVDPGEHVVRFETAHGESIEQRIIVHEGQKRALVTATFAPVMPATPKVDERRPRDRELTTVPLVLGVVAFAGVATFAGFGLSGKADERELSATCGSRCEPNAVDPIRTKYIVADVALGTSILAAGSALWLFFSQPRRR